MVREGSICRKIIRKQPWSFKIYSNYVLLWNGRWISNRDKSENLQPVKNENLVINTPKWKSYVATNQATSLPIILPVAVRYYFNSWNWFFGEWLDVWFSLLRIVRVWFVGKSLSPSFVFNLKRIWVNWLTSTPSEIIKSHRFAEFQGQ